MHLVEGVGLQDALVCCADEDLQAQLLFASVSMQLQGEKESSVFCDSLIAIQLQLS